MDLDGALDGWSLDAEFELDDGQVIHGPVTFRPNGRVPFGSLSAAAYGQLSLSTVMVNFEHIMKRIEAAAPGALVATGWVDALAARKRPGRRGQDPNVYLLWARRRVEAEDQAPNRPIKWMVEHYGENGVYSEAT